MGGQGGGRDAHGFGTVEADRTDVAGFQLVGAHHFAMGFHDGLFVIGHLHLEDVCGIEQAFGMLAQAEDRRAFGRLVSSHALEHAHAVMKCMCQDVGGGIAPGYQLAIVPDEAVAVGHGHESISSKYA